jgi:pectate lyase/fibronectin type 3 domain-containing protein
MFKQSMKIIVFALIALTLTASAAFAVDGFASMNGGTTGGAGGPTVTVTNEADLAYYVNRPAAQPYIVQVSGTITCANPIWPKSNKTIIGLGSNAKIDGTILCRMEGGVPVSNIIFQNLTVTNPRSLFEGDGIQIKYGIKNVWVDHCTFYDCADGCVDVTMQSDFVTISWCKFYYSHDTTHNFPNLIGHSDTETADEGKLHVTMHHNWWASGCIERMPRVRYGQVHLYNNYYDVPVASMTYPGAKYCIGVSTAAKIRVESNYFSYNSKRPNTVWKNPGGYGTGIIGWDSDNEFAAGTTVPTWAPNAYATIFVPPYSYTTDDGLSVPGIVMAGAGAGGGAPPPPDTTPPTPNPMTWATVPAAVSSSSITMTATTATDTSGVEYYFECLTAGGHSSDWQASSTYTDTGLSASTQYTYRVKAQDLSAAMNQTAYSSNASATTLAPALPAVPTGLTATAGNTQVSLSWSASSGATSYNVKRATVSGGPYTTIASPTTNSYINTGLTNGTTYYYVVSAVNAVGESSNSAQVSATPSCSLAAVPTGLTATAGNAQVSLSWAASSGATSYNVKRATVSGGPYTTIASPTTTSYINTGLVNGTTYYYVVSAVNACGESSSSAQVSATPSACTLPAAPSTPSLNVNNNDVVVKWTAVTGATSYNVKRATVSGGPYTTLGNKTASPYTDSTTVQGNTYYYVVSALNACGEGPNSAQKSISR